MNARQFRDRDLVRAAGSVAETTAGTPLVPILMVDGSIADLNLLLPGQVDFAHIALTLSKVSRFNGRHVGQAYSVAQHSVMGADAVMAETGDAVMAGYFLLHDAHEYLLGDIGRPSIVAFDQWTLEILVERGVDPKVARGAVAEAVGRAKAALDIPIHKAAGLPPIDTIPLYARKVAEMDERMCFAEARALYGARGPIPLVRCDLPPPRLTGAIRPWGAMKAEEAFLARLQRYLGIEARAA